MTPCKYQQYPGKNHHTKDLQSSGCSAEKRAGWILQRKITRYIIEQHGVAEVAVHQICQLTKGIQQHPQGQALVCLESIRSTKGNELPHQEGQLQQQHREK